MQQLVCPNCNTSIPAENVNIAQTLAICPRCNTVFDFGDIGKSSTEKHTPEERKRRKMHPPKGFNTRETAEGFVMAWRWFQPIALFLTFFVIAWDSFLVFWYSMAFGSSFNDGFNLIMVVFPVGHVAVGVGLTYYVLALYLNQTAVTVNDAEVTVYTFPLPYPWKDKRIATSDIEQVYVKQKFSRSSKSTSITYEVHLQRYGASDEVLVTGLDNADFALYLEQEIEAYLGIEDRSVFGEYGG